MPFVRVKQFVPWNQGGSTTHGYRIEKILTRLAGLFGQFVGYSLAGMCIGLWRSCAPISINTSGRFLPSENRRICPTTARRAFVVRS